MSMRSKQKEFGQKGAGAQAKSLAEALLSGKPMGRNRPRQGQNVPKLKPRPKPVFGRKAEAERTGTHLASKRLSWTVGLAVCGVCVAIVVRLVAAS